MASGKTQRITFVSGKGGVGKSAVAAALAESIAQSGVETLLVELGDRSYFQSVYGSEVGYEPRQLKSNLSLALLSGEACLREYVSHLVKIPRVADLFFDNRIMKAFVKAAPALRELAILGKITSGIRNWGPPFQYEHIVVDCYATGHFLALIQAPKGMSELIEFGPMGEQSRNIHRVLCDAEFCNYVLVSIPEELPISETEELFDKTKSFTGMTPKVFLNKSFHSPVPQAELGQLLKEKPPGISPDFVQYVLALEQRQSKSIETLNQKSISFQELPFQFSSNAQDVISDLATEVGAK